MVRDCDNPNWITPSKVFIGEEPLYPVVDTSNAFSIDSLENIDGEYIGIDDVTPTISSASISFEITGDKNAIKALFTPPTPPKLPRKIKKKAKKHIIDCPKKCNKWLLAAVWSFNTKKKRWLNGISFDLVQQCP